MDLTGEQLREKWCDPQDTTIYTHGSKPDRIRAECADELGEFLAEATRGHRGAKDPRA
jgi:hypothetical protein